MILIEFNHHLDSLDLTFKCRAEFIRSEGEPGSRSITDSVDLDSITAEHRESGAVITFDMLTEGEKSEIERVARAKLREDPCL